MDRNRYPVSVVPFPTDRPTSARRITQVDEREWDEKWLRPKLIPVPSSPEHRVVAKPTLIEKIEVPQQARPSAAKEVIQDKPQEEIPALPLYLRFLRWLFPDVNQRRAKRFATPGLVAYYWTGGAPYSYQVGDMSATGLFLLTKERWAPGTLIQMTLQPQSGRVTNDNSICVLSEVVRWSDNGAGFNFILKDYDNVQEYGISSSDAVDRKAVEKFLQKMGVPAVH